MPNADPLISAVICAYNRVELLCAGVQSLVSQTLPADLYEILVVDNCSTDGTAKMMRERFSQIGNLRYIYEGRLGTCHARNTGWKEARGEYVAYLDDDAAASPEWLERILAAFRNVKPQPGVVGGRIILDWTGPPPDWLTPGNLLSLGELNTSPGPSQTQKPDALIGCNIAYPRALLRGLGGFNIELGRYGKSLLSSDEIHLNSKIVAAGKWLYYDPGIVVRHHVHSERLKMRWHLRRAFWQGISSGVTEILLGNLSAGTRVKRALSESRYLLMPPIRTVLIAPDKRQKLYVWARNYLRRAGNISAYLGIHRFLVPKGTNRVGHESQTQVTKGE